MGFISRIVKRFRKQKPQLGTVFLKPSEKKSAAGISKKTGATISIPATKETYSPQTKTFVSRGGGGQPAQQITVAGHPITTDKDPLKLDVTVSKISERKAQALETTIRKRQTEAEARRKEVIRRPVVIPIERIRARNEKKIFKRETFIQRLERERKARVVAMREERKEHIKLSDLTKKAFAGAEKRGWSKERMASLITIRPELIDTRLRFLPQKQRNALKKLEGVKKEIVIGMLESVEKEPEKIVLVTAASIAAPAVLAGLGGALKASKFIKPVLKIVPKSVQKKGGKAVSRFLTSAYLGSTGLQIAATPSGERARKTGRILATEVIPFSIGTRLGVRGLLRNNIKNELRTEVNKLPSNKRDAFKDYMKQAELFGKYEPKVKNIRLDNIESITSKKAQTTIRKYLKSNNERVVLGGSVAQTGQIKVKRKLGDMDLYVEKGLNPNQAAKNLAKQLKKSGVKRVSQIRGQVTIAGKKSVEFHDISRLKTNIEQVIPSWQSANKYIIKTPEGIRIQRIGLQARRKLVAAFADPKRLATGKYKKDLKDFKTIADKIFKNAELKSRQAFFFRGKKIKAVGRVFRRRISRKPLRVKKKFIKIKPKKIIKKKIVKKIKIKPKVKRKKVKRKKLTPSQLRARKKRIKKLTPSQRRIRRIKRKIRITKYPKRRPRKITKYPPIKRPKKPKKPKPIKPKKPKPTKYPPIKPKKPVKIIIPKKPKKPKPIKPKKPKLPILWIKKKKIRKIKKKKKIQAWNVFARPLKKKGAKRKPKLVKVNVVPLSKKRAESLRNYITDKSLSRTSQIKPTRGKIGKPKLKVPISYAVKTKYKFRTHRRFKKKRIPLKKGRVIERRKHLIDSRGEKRGLSLRRAIAQLKKKSIKKPIRKIKRKITPPQKKELLKRLKKARVVRMSNLKKKK